MSRFAEKLDSQNSENTMGNCVHYLYGIVYIICTECLDLQKIWISWTDGKLCTLYMYGMSGFAEKWNIQNCVSRTGNCVHYICMECLDLHKIFNIQNYNNSTGNCIQYLYRMSGLAKKLNIQKCVYLTENCVQYICTACLDRQRNWMSRTA